MQEIDQGPGKARFGDFEVDFRTGDLRRRGILIPIQAKPLTVLATLVEHPGELVSREALHRALWPSETFVDFDKNLGVAVAKLREILNDSAAQPRYIETIPRRGYRFLCSLESSPLVRAQDSVAKDTSGLPSAPRQASSLIPETTQVVARSGVAVDLSPNASDRYLPRRFWIVAGALAVIFIAGVTIPSGFVHKLIASSKTTPRQMNPEAQQDYQKAKEFSERWIVDDVKSALIFDNRAIALEPNYAAAFALRAALLERLGEMGVIDSEQACNRARADARSAIKLDPNLAAGYVSLAGIQMNHDWDLNAAEATLNTASHLEPNELSVVNALSSLRRYRGQLDESILLQRRVISLAPFQSGSYGSLAIRLFGAGKLDEALSAQQRALELDPQLEYVHLNRAEVLLAKGLPNEALREVESEPGEVWRQLGQALVLHDLGRTSESNTALEQLIAKHSEEPYNIACVYAYRGELDQSFAWLDRAYDRHDVSLIELKTDPLLRNLRLDPRYMALLQRMKI